MLYRIEIDVRVPDIAGDLGENFAVELLSAFKGATGNMDLEPLQIERSAIMKLIKEQDDGKKS